MRWKPPEWTGAPPAPVPRRSTRRSAPARPLPGPNWRRPLAAQKTELVDRLAKMERILVDRISETERVLGDRLAEMERRLAALLWRLFGGMVALAGLVVAVLKLLP